MKVIEHIKPKGECTLKVKVWLLDERIEMQILKQKRRGHIRIWAHVDGVSVHTVDMPEIWRDAIYLRGAYGNEDKRKSELNFLSNEDRDAYYAKMKIALAAAAEAMK